MRIFYHHARNGNFGDDLNSWIWNEVFPGLSERSPDLVLVGIGTILNDDICVDNADAGRLVCFGSGAGYGTISDCMANSKWIHKVVRGPLSARLLGLDGGCVGTDGAILLATLPRYAAPATKSGETIFIPHHEALGWPHWERAAADAGLTFVNPVWDSHVVLERIRSASLVIADSMHAAICADTFRVPWIPVTTSSRISSFKWTDWAASMGMSYNPVHLPHPSFWSILEDRLSRRMGDDHRTGAADHAELVNSIIEKQRRSPPVRSRLGKFADRAAMAVARRVDHALNRRSPLYTGIVKSLKAVQSERHYLSSDAFFADRLDMMCRHREAIRALM